MQIHGRAKLGPAGRLALCEAIEGGMTFRQAAAGMGVSPATAHRWWRRYREHVGYEFAHAIVDDHSRLAYVELHGDERAATVTAFTERALAWFQSNGIYAKRLMTDNAFTYLHNRSLRELLAARKIKHLRTQPYRPQTNGKVERFHQTMAREWAYGLSYRSSTHRTQALPHWLQHYNTRRPHSGIGNSPPINRVHNLRGQNS
jgi:transposase InsO family protein